MNINDIAEKVGYKSLSNFIAQFKKSKSITPKQYRKLKNKVQQKDLSNELPF